MNEENSLQNQTVKSGIEKPIDQVIDPPTTTDMAELPKEMRVAISMMAGMFRSTTGPDPETAKVLAETEMHEESCKLEAYKESLLVRDKQNERDDEFRKMKMNHETAKSAAVMVICLGAIVCGLYLLVAKHDSQIGTPILVAAFTVLIGGKNLTGKEKE